MHPLTANMHQVTMTPRCRTVPWKNARYTVRSQLKLTATTRSFVDGLTDPIHFFRRCLSPTCTLALLLYRRSPYWLRSLHPRNIRSVSRCLIDGAWEPVAAKPFKVNPTDSWPISLVSFGRTAIAFNRLMTSL